MFVINIFEYVACLSNKPSGVILPVILVNSKGCVVLLIIAFHLSLLSSKSEFTMLWNVAGIAGLDFLVSKCKK